MNLVWQHARDALELAVLDLRAEVVNWWLRRRLACEDAGGCSAACSVCQARVTTRCRGWRVEKKKGCGYVFVGCTTPLCPSCGTDVGLGESRLPMCSDCWPEEGPRGPSGRAAGNGLVLREHTARIAEVERERSAVEARRVSAQKVHTLPTARYRMRAIHVAAVC